MKKRIALLTILVIGCIFVIAQSLPISRFPNVSTPNDSDLFVLAQTQAPATNKNIRYDQLRGAIRSGMATETYVNNISNILAQVGGNIELLTNSVRLGFVTNINWTYGMTGSVSSSTAVLGVDDSLANSAASNGLLNIIITTSNFLFTSSSLTGTTNFMNFSVQAAKLPATNYPGIDGGNQSWEVLYYHTNAENAVANLSATWQFVVPPDYATNTGKLHVQHMLLATNGPNASNVVWTVDCVRSHSGDNVNLHTSAFGTQVSGTNTWAQSSTITHAQTDLVINLNTNLMWQAGDLVVMRLTRNLTNDTYRNTGVGLVGMQLEYTRQ